MIISEEADGDSSSEEDQEMVDIRNEQYTRDDVSVQDDVDTEAPQQAPKEAPEETLDETPEETSEQSSAPADDHIDIPLMEEEITILTSGEEEGGTQQEEPRPVKVICIELNEENAPVSCKWGSFLPSNHTFIY